MLLSTSLDPGAVEIDDLEHFAPLLFTLLEATPDLVCLISPEGVIRFVNRTVPGVTPEQLLGRSVFGFIDPRQHAAALACYREVARTGEPGMYEAIGLGPHGEMARYESRVAPVRHGDRIVALAIIARDITQRVEMERALRESRRKLEVAITASGLGLWSLDVREGTVEVDDGILRIYRRARAEAPGTVDALLETVYPEDRAFVEAGIRESLTSGECPDLEFRIVRLDGTTAWILVKGRAIRDEAGQIVGLMGGAADVTTLRQAAASLRASEQRYRSLIAVLEEGILVQDRDRTIHAFNASARRILGLTEAQVAGEVPLHPRWRAVHEDGAPFSDPAVCPIFTAHAGEPRSGTVVGIHKPEGQLTWVLVNSRALPGPGPEGSVVVSFFDITEHKNVEIETERVLGQEQAARRRAVLLSETSKLLASSVDVLSSLGAVVARMAPEHFDLAVIELLDEEGGLGTAHPVVVAADDPALAERYCELRRRRAVEATSPLLATVRRRESKLLAAGADGDPAPLVGIPAEEALADRMRFRSTALVPLLARARPYGVMIIGARARALHPDDIALAEELALRTAQAIDIARMHAEMEVALARREEFIAVAAHELRTPLTPILMQSERLLRLARGTEQLPSATVVPRLEVIDRQLVRLHRLIEEMLDVSNITSGGLALEIQDVDVVVVIRGAVERFADELARARCEARLELPPTAVGRWDRTRLEQIAANLLANAVKYGAGSPIEIKVEVEDGAARLSVRDHGIGISVHDQQRIFQRFERAVSERHYGGLGLGLWVTRHMAEAMGGSVRVESEPGVGSTFVVTLPRGR